MDTVAFNTVKNNQELTNDEKELVRYFSAHAKYCMKSKETFATFNAPLDFLLDNAGVMSNLFSTLERSWGFGLKELQTACIFYSENAKCSSQEKANVIAALSNWLIFTTEIATFSRIISEKAFYYQELEDKLLELINKNQANDLA